MMCAWKELLGILPVHLRGEVDLIGKETMQELRLRINSPPELALEGKRHRLTRNTTKDRKYSNRFCFIPCFLFVIPIFSNLRIVFYVK